MPDDAPWISVTDRLPAEGRRYLVHVPTGNPNSPFVGVAWWNLAGARWELLPEPLARSVTHWMEIPGVPGA